MAVCDVCGVELVDGGDDLLVRPQVLTRERFAGGAEQRTICSSRVCTAQASDDLRELCARPIPVSRYGTFADQLAAALVAHADHDPSAAALLHRVREVRAEGGERTALDRTAVETALDDLRYLVISGRFEREVDPATGRIREVARLTPPAARVLTRAVETALALLDVQVRAVSIRPAELVVVRVDGDREMSEAAIRMLQTQVQAVVDRVPGWRPRIVVSAGDAFRVETVADEVTVAGLRAEVERLSAQVYHVRRELTRWCDAPPAEFDGCANTCDMLSGLLDEIGGPTEG